MKTFAKFMAIQNLSLGQPIEEVLATVLAHCLDLYATLYKLKNYWNRGFG